MRKRMALLLCVCLCQVVVCAYAEQPTLSITELRQQTEVGWHETYEAHGRTVTVDIPVQVPDVDTCPILTIKRGALPNEDATQEYTQQQRLTEIGHWAGTMGESDDPPRLSSWKDMQVFENGAIPDFTPENNPTTFEEAWQVLDNAFESIYGFGMDDFSLRSVTVFGRIYRYQVKDAARVWGQAETEKGFYDIWANQRLHGIAITRGPEYTHYSASAMPMYGECGGNIYDAQRYLATMQYVVEEAAVEEDVPLLPFDKVKIWLENQIEDGLVREISSVELQYIGFFNPTDKDTNYAVPVWHVRAVHATDAKREYKGLHVDKLGDYVEDRPWEDMYFLAQTGEYLDPESTARNRRDVPDLLTWADVKK